MFVQQGARQFEIWTGKPAPIAEMGYVVTKTLERQAAEKSPEEPKVPVRAASKRSSQRRHARKATPQVRYRRRLRRA